MHVKLDSNESVFRPDNASDIALINHLAEKSWSSRSLPSLPSPSPPMLSAAKSASLSSALPRSVFFWHKTEERVLIMKRATLLHKTVRWMTVQWNNWRTKTSSDLNMECKGRPMFDNGHTPTQILMKLSIVFQWVSNCVVLWGRGIVVQSHPISDRGSCETWREKQSTLLGQLLPARDVKTNKNISRMWARASELWKRAKVRICENRTEMETHSW